MYPSLPVVDADPESDRALLEAIADWCDRYTPLVGLDPPDGLMLDVTGCAHLFGGEQALGATISSRGSRGRVSRAGRSPTRSAAPGRVARYGEASLVPKTPRATACCRCRSRRCASMLRSLPRWHRPGSSALADLVDAPARAARRALRARLYSPARSGARPRGRTDHAAPAAAVAMAEQRFPDPIAREADVLGTIEHLARELGRRAGAARRGRAAVPGGAVPRRRQGASARDRHRRAAARSRPHASACSRSGSPSLGDACDPGFGYDMVRLSALVTERLDPAQTGLAGSDHASELAHLIDRLGARFGAAPGDAAHAAGHAYSGICGGGRARACGARRHRCRSHRAGQPRSAVRPIRLFARPEPIEAIAEVPDGPPVRFRWRHVLHEVAAAEGPERIAMEWWRDDGRPRADARLFPRREQGRARGSGSIAKGFTAARPAAAALVSAWVVCVSA